MRTNLMKMVNKADVGGIAGIGLTVYDDGAVGLTSSGITTLAGVGAAGLVLLFPPAAVVTIAAVVVGAAVSIWGEKGLYIAFGVDGKKQILKDAIRAVNNKIGEAIHDAYFKAVEISNGALNADDRTVQQAIDSWVTQAPMKPLAQ